MGLALPFAVTMMPERRELADRLLRKVAGSVACVLCGTQETTVVAGGGLFIHVPEAISKSILERDPHGARASTRS